jgi:hypothetical protein
MVYFEGESKSTLYVFLGVFFFENQVENETNFYNDLL